MISKKFDLSVRQALGVEIAIMLIPLLLVLYREEKWLKIATANDNVEKKNLSRQAYGRRFLFMSFYYLFGKTDISTITDYVNLNYYVTISFVMLVVWMYGNKYKRMAIDRGYA